MGGINSGGGPSLHSRTSSATIEGNGQERGPSLPATISSTSSSASSAVSLPSELETRQLLTRSNSKTETKVKDFLAKMKELGSSIKEKLYPTALMDALSHGVSITSKVNSGLGLAHLASSCINKAVHALGIASGALSIADGIRDVVSAVKCHSRAQKVEGALADVNRTLQHHDLVKAACTSEVKAAWAKMVQLETLLLKQATLMEKEPMTKSYLTRIGDKIGDKVAGIGDKVAETFGASSGEVKQATLMDEEQTALLTNENTLPTNENTLLRVGETKELMDLKAELLTEKMQTTLATLDNTPGLKDYLEALDLKTALETSATVLKERSVDKAIVGCINIAVGIVGVVANVVTLGLAAPLVGLITWGSGQAVKVCLRAYRTYHSPPQTEINAAVETLKKCQLAVKAAGGFSVNVNNEPKTLLDCQRKICLTMRLNVDDDKKTDKSIDKFTKNTTNLRYNTTKDSDMGDKASAAMDVLINLAT